MISIYKDFDNPPKDLLGGTPKITKAVKQALYDLYHGKCAFTEEKLSFEEMEVAHYRPKSLYPELEFEWSNLLPVSKRVNAILSNHFPIDGKRVDRSLLVTSENRKADSVCLLGEQPHLLHPEVDTPENHLTVSRFGKLEGLTNKGNQTVYLSDLNFEYTPNINKKPLPNVRKIRKKHFDKIEQIIKQLKEVLKSNYTPLDFNFNEGQIKYINSPLPQRYSLLLEPFLEKLHQFTEKKQAFSHASYSFIRGQLTVYNNTAGSTEEEASLNNIMGQIIKVGYQSFVSPPFSIEKDWAKSKFPSIASLHIQQFHSIKNLHLPTVPINSKWIFLTGENGAGKSLILQAIALGFQNRRFDFAGLTNNTRIELEINTIQYPLRIILDNEFSYYDTTNFYKFAAYGPSRLYIKEAYTDQVSYEEKFSSIFQKSNTLENIESYLAQLYNRDSFKEQYESIKRVLLELLPTIDDIDVNTNSVEKRVSYTEKGTSNLSNHLSFQELSSGNQSIIAMIGDMIIRLIKAQNIDNISDLEGIVLIDEIDIHLHPNWQKKFVQTLTRLFPKIQFIASTHSPIPLLGAPKETVILNVEKPSSREGIKVNRLDIDVTTLTPNTILTSPIFGFEGLSSVESEGQPLIYTQEGYDDVAFEKALKENLKKLADDDDLSKYIIEKK